MKEVARCDGNVLHLHPNGGFMGVCSCKNPLCVCTLLGVHHKSIKKDTIKNLGVWGTLQERLGEGREEEYKLRDQAVYLEPQPCYVPFS